MINQRLFDQYNIDTKKDLKIKNRCPRPYDTVLIDKQGSCYACECTSWLPQSIGNLQLKSLDEIVRSPMSTQLQESISDGSYRYCNNNQCSYILDKRSIGNVPWSTSKPERKIKHIRLAIDDSCNLSCPSCRTKQIFERDKHRLQRKYAMSDKIIKYVKSISHNVNIHVGSDGDPFASLVYRYFIKKTKDLPNVRFTIQTNGLLIKKMYQRHTGMFEKLDVLNVSIDGATKQTYEKLRRGGSFEAIVNNLMAVNELKRKHNFKFVLHFVVQKQNYLELETMAKLAESCGADRLWFNRITNWNTFSDFAYEDVLDARNDEYEKCMDAINQLKKKNYKVLIEMPTLIR